MNMKKLVAGIAVSMTLGMGAMAAEATPFWVGSVNAGTDGWVSPVQNFDWSSSGSGNAIAVGPFGKTLTVGDTFDFLYQAELVALGRPNGSTISTPGLSNTYEFTLVAKFPEIVTFAAPGFATFSTLPGGSFYMYYDGTPNSSVGAGMGFDDGVLVASGSINAGNVGSFLVANPTTGVGSTILEGLVSYANSAYLDPTMVGGNPFIIDFRYEGTLNYPPLDSATSNFFLSRAGEGNYADYTVATDDLILKVDGSNKFSVVPEPSTVLLLGMGMLGIAGYARKRVVKK